MTLEEPKALITLTKHKTLAGAHVKIGEAGDLVIEENAPFEFTFRYGPSRFLVHAVPTEGGDKLDLTITGII